MGTLKVDPGQTVAAGPRELRLALAMRGGVSLAVWIGGAVAEIDRLRRAAAVAPAATGTPEWVYQRLLAAARYQGVRVDVLAGASAGGLNAVIYAYAQVRGLGLDFVRRVWLGSGSLWALMQPAWRPFGDTADARRFRLRSLLSGDYFYTTLRRALRDQQPPEAPLPAPEFLSVDLSATLRQAGVLPPEGRPASSEAHFRFQHHPTSGPNPYNDFHDLTGPGGQLDRLALAARSTSSFPGAFEPALINVGHADTAAAPSMKEVFAAEGGPAGPPEPEAGFYQVIDGGVFDNTPIDRAVAAIAASPASGPTERKLVYLDPAPPEPVAAPGQPGASLLSTLVRTGLLKTRGESADAEIDRLRADNDRELRARGQAELLSLADLSGLAADSHLAQRYTGYRATQDATRLGEAARAPHLRFLRSAVPRPDDLVAWRPTRVLNLKNLVVPAYDRYFGDDPGFGEKLLADETSVLTMATTLLAWARLLERVGVAEADAGALGEVKRVLYRVRAIAVHQQDLADLYLVRLPEIAWTSDGGVAVTGYHPPGLPAVPTSETDLWTELGGLLDPASADGPTTAPLWSALHEQYGLLAGIQPLDSSTDWWAQNVFSVLTARVPPDPEAMVRLNAAICVTGGPIGAGELVEYVYLTGDQQPAAGLDLGTLRADAAQADQERFVAGRGGPPTPADPGGMVRSRAKLAGTLLGNFGGFLDAGWRSHDWAWGRADAAAALVDLFAAEIRQLKKAGVVAQPTLAEIAAELAPDADGTPIDKVKAALQGPFVSEAALNVASPSWADLRPGYRFGVVARMAQLAFRALWPLGDFAPSAAGAGPGGPLRWWRVLVAVVLAVLRPVWVVLPLVMRPAVLVAAAVSLLVLTHPSEVPAPSGAWLYPGPAIVALAALVAAVRIWVRAKRWGAVAADAPNLLAGVATRRRFGAVLVGLGGVLLAAGTMWLSVSAGWSLTPLESVAYVVAGVVLAQAAVTRSGRHPHRRRRGDPRGWGVVALGIGLAVLVRASASVLGDGVLPVAAGLAAGGLAFAVHHAWCRRWALWSISVVVGLLTGLVAVLTAGSVPLVLVATLGGAGGAALTTLMAPTVEHLGSSPDADAVMAAEAADPSL